MFLAKLLLLILILLEFDYVVEAKVLLENEF